MKLKFAFLALVFIGLSSAIVAQTSDEETEAIVNLLGVKKKQAVAELKKGKTSYYNKIFYLSLYLIQYINRQKYDC